MTENHVRVRVIEMEGDPADLKALFAQLGAATIDAEVPKQLEEQLDTKAEPLRSPPADRNRCKKCNEPYTSAAHRAHRGPSFARTPEGEPATGDQPELDPEPKPSGS